MINIFKEIKNKLINYNEKINWFIFFLVSMFTIGKFEFEFKIKVFPINYYIIYTF